MIRTVCDKCGKTLKERSAIPSTADVYLTFEPKGGWFFEQAHYVHLCGECEEEVYKFIYGDRVKEKEAETEDLSF